MKFLRRGVSESLNYSSLFQSWEIAIVEKLVRDFREKWSCLKMEEPNDLYQECFTHWFFKRDQYDDGGRASRQTFMGKVIRNKLTDLVRERESDKRKVAYYAVSLDESLGDEEDSPTLLERIDESGAACVSPDFSLQIGLKVDLSNAQKKLTPSLKKLCDLILKEFTVSEISKCLDTPRSTVCDEMKRIGDLFKKEGLKEYLK